MGRSASLRSPKQKNLQVKVGQSIRSRMQLGRRREEMEVAWWVCFGGEGARREQSTYWDESKACPNPAASSFHHFDSRSANVVLTNASTDKSSTDATASKGGMRLKLKPTLRRPAEPLAAFPTNVKLAALETSDLDTSSEGLVQISRLSLDAPLNVPGSIKRNVEVYETTPDREQVPPTTQAIPTSSQKPATTITPGADARGIERNVEVYETTPDREQVPPTTKADTAAPPQPRKSARMAKRLNYQVNYHLRSTRQNRDIDAILLGLTHSVEHLTFRPKRNLLGLPQELQDIIFDLVYSATKRFKWATLECLRLRRACRLIGANVGYWYEGPHNNALPQPKVCELLVSKQYFVGAVEVFIRNQSFDRPSGSTQAVISGSFPTLDEVRATIPTIGIDMDELIALFNRRISGHAARLEFDRLVKVAATSDRATRKWFPKLDMLNSVPDSMFGLYCNGQLGVFGAFATAITLPFRFAEVSSPDLLDQLPNLKKLTLDVHWNDLASSHTRRTTGDMLALTDFGRLITKTRIIEVCGITEFHARPAQIVQGTDFQLNVEKLERLLMPIVTRPREHKKDQQERDILQDNGTPLYHGSKVCWERPTPKVVDKSTELTLHNMPKDVAGLKRMLDTDGDRMLELIDALCEDNKVAPRSDRMLAASQQTVQLELEDELEESFGDGSEGGVPVY
ncbi:uncharacterized protein LTR77_002359 [Saxophila tyrrhenica]|uniref:F-box domain-containing protein n=1 Tax=Saxophila tyrrhenica TaxID=1690608 RepID=A0AAV9PN60_9PEZI|nr:hypothetical protein LTR77_002359 [Saxophila tyrrhenica]